MKKSLLFLLLVIPFFAQAQLEMDDFETYTVGGFDAQWDASQYVGWFGGASGTEISDEQAASGVNSLKVSDNPTADDLIALLPVINSGIYELSFKQYIPAANGAYFNLQHNYTNSAGDWALDVFFADAMAGAAVVRTNATDFTFPIVHDEWADIRFELNFLMEEGTFYYNDELILTWVLPTNSDGGPGLNQINAINFYAACANTGCVSLAYYDDIVLTEVPLPAYDLLMTAIAPATEYYHVPITQTKAINLETSVFNGGLNPVTNVSVNTEIYDENNDLVFTESLGTVPSLASGESMVLNSAASSYTPSATGMYSVEYTATLDEMDEAMGNNRAASSFVVTDSIYSRDNGVYTNGIGVNGQSALLGQIFEIVNTDVVTGINITYAGGGIGETLQGSIITEENGTPVDLIATTDVYTIETIGGGIGAEVKLGMTFTSPVELEPGRYVFMVEQQGPTNLILSTSDAIFTPNTTFVSADQGSTWGTLESFDFEVMMAIRPVFGDAMVAVEEPIFAPSIELTPNVTAAQTMLSLELETVQDLTIEVFDINGQRVAVQQVNKASGMVQQELDLSNQASGTYIVTVSSEGKRASRKLQVLK